MSDGDVLGFFVLIIVVVFGVSAFSYQYGKVGQREETCREYFKGEPSDNGSICIKDGKVVVRL